MPMLWGILSWMLVLGDLNPGRSIVRDHDDQRVRAEQLAKRNAGADMTDGVSLANMMGTVADARKHRTQEVQNLEGQEGMDDEEEVDDDAFMDHINTSSAKQDDHFKTPNKELNELLENMKNLCDLNKCKTTEDELLEIFHKVEVPPPVDPYPPPLTVDIIAKEREKKCCTPPKKIDLKILIEVIHTITVEEEMIWAEVCKEEGVHAQWTTHKTALTTLLKSTPGPYEGLPYDPKLGGDATPAAEDTGGGGSPVPAPAPGGSPEFDPAFGKVTKEDADAINGPTYDEHNNEVSLVTLDQPRSPHSRMHW